MDTSNVIDPPDTKNRQGKSKSSKKTKPVLSRDEEKRRYLGHVYSTMLFTYDFSEAERNAEQIVVSAKFDKLRPVVENSKPSEKASASDDSRTSEKAEPTSHESKPASDKAKPISEESEPASDKAKSTPDEAKPASEVAKPRAEETKSTSDEAGPKSEKAEPVSDKVKLMSEEAEPTSEKPKPASEEAKSTSDEAMPTSDVPLESKPSVVADSKVFTPEKPITPEESRPSATPEPSQSMMVPPAKPVDSTKVSLEEMSTEKSKVTTVPATENPKSTESQEKMTVVPSSSELSHQTTKTLDPKPTGKSNATKVLPSANSTPTPQPSSPSKILPRVVRQRYASSSSDEGGWEHNAETEYEAKKLAKIMEAVKKYGKEDSNRRPDSSGPSAPTPLKQSQGPSTNTAPLAVVTQTPQPPTVFKSGTMQEQLISLTEKERQIYNEALEKLSARHGISFFPCPVDQEFNERLEIVEKFGIEQSIRFQAMAGVWSARGVPSVDQDEECDLSPFVKTVNGHYGLYQVQENLGDRWRATAWYPTKLQEVFVTDKSMLVGSKLSALPTLIIGDVLVVKELLESTVLKCQIVMRRIKLGQAARLKNKRYVVKGYGRAVDFETDQTKLKFLRSVSVYVPIQCSPETPNVLKIKEFKAETKKDNSWSAMWQDSRERRQQFTPEFADHMVVLGSSLYSALQFGSFDEQVYQGYSFRQIRHDLVQFNTRIDTESSQLWIPGVHVSVGYGQWLLDLTEISYMRDRNYHIVTGNLLHGKPSALVTTYGQRPVQQVGARIDRPVLEPGVFQKMNEKSNGRRIISAIFGSREEWDEPKEQMNDEELSSSTKTYSKHQMMAIRTKELKPNLRLPNQLRASEHFPNVPQSEYIARLLRNETITVGKFPILSGKTSTVAMAALRLAQKDPKSTNLVLTPDSQRSKMMLDKIKELNKVKMNNEVQAVRMCSDFNLKQFLVDITAGKFPFSDSLRVKAKKSFQNLEYASLDYWLQIHFQLDPPQILILDCQEFWRISKHLLNVKSVQFDDMHQIPEMELIQICTVFPEAIFGLMMDRTAPTLQFEIFFSHQNSLVAGESLIKAELFFPVVQSKDVYNVPADVLKLISRQFGGVNGFWIDSHVQRRLEDYPIQLHSIYMPADYTKVMMKLASEATVPPEEIGVLCATVRQMICAKQCKGLSDRILIGLPHDFRGIRKRMMIILTDIACKTIHSEIVFILTRASETTHLVQYQNKLDVNEDWKSLLRMVVEDKKNIAQLQRQHRRQPARHFYRPQ